MTLEMSAEILQLPDRRVGEAVDVLVRAFQEDPILTFFLHARSRRNMAFRAFFGSIIRAHLCFGHVYAAFVEDRVAGVAVWRPPAAGAETFRDRVRERWTRVFVRLLFPHTAGGLFRGFEATLALHPLPKVKVLLLVSDGKPLQGPRVDFAIGLHSAQGRYGNENPKDVEPGGRCTLYPLAWVTANGAADLSDINLSFRSETLSATELGGVLDQAFDIRVVELGSNSGERVEPCHE